MPDIKSLVEIIKKLPVTYDSGRTTPYSGEPIILYYTGEEMKNIIINLLISD